MSDTLQRNDGTDTKKNDPDVDSTNRSTTRTCDMMVANHTGFTITKVVLTHTSGDHTTVLSVDSLKPSQNSQTEKITFETGFNAHFDYWNISFSCNGWDYTTPYNDRCNISYEDAGHVIRCEVSPKSKCTFNLHVKMPRSSGCNFVIE